eukprot:jgi/Psemu1/6566/gm1.6566_g
MGSARLSAAMQRCSSYVYPLPTAEDGVYYIYIKEEGEGEEEKTDTTLSAFGPIPLQIDVMVNFFLYEVDNGVTGVLGLLTKKQISKRSKDYNMNNKWVKFESLLRNVHDKKGRADTTSSLSGRNVVNYVTIKKYMIMYREILVWYMENVQYPPGPENTSKGLGFHTKCQNGSPHDSKHYVTAMKNVLDCLMAKSSLPVSLSHSYNQVDLDKHFKLQHIECLKSLPTHRLQLALCFLWVHFQGQLKQIFRTLSICHLNIQLLTHKEFYQYFLPELFQNSFILGTTLLSGEKFVPVGFHQQGDMNIPNTGLVLLPFHYPLVFHYILNYTDTVSTYYNIHFEFDNNRVTLSPCKLGTGNIDLAPFTVTKEIIYLVKEMAILPKVLKVHDNGFFGYEHVMETIEDLVLTERRFLGGAVFPKLSNDDLAYCQRNDCLYIYPLAMDLSKTQFAHVKFEDTPEPLVTGILELYLPEMGTIFTPLTEKLAGYLLENSDDLLSANLQVQFLDENVVDNFGKETGELNRAFNHLQGRDFVFHKLLDFETWDCLKTSKGDIERFNESQNHLQNKGGNKPPGKNSKETGSDSDTVTKTNQHKGKNNKRGSLDAGDSLEPKAKKSKQSGNGAKAKGAKQSLAIAVAAATAPTANGGKVVPSPHAHMVSKVTENAAAVSAVADASSAAPSLAEKSEMGEKDGTNDWEEKVPRWKHTMNVALPKFPLRVGQPLESTDISVVLKEPDPEILYPIHQINEQVCYIGGQVPDRIGEVVKYLYSKYEHYDAYPGYGLVF